LTQRAGWASSSWADSQNGADLSPFHEKRKEKAMNVRSRAALLFMSALTIVLRASTSAAQTLTATPIIPSVVVSPAAQAPQLGPSTTALSVAVRTTVPMVPSAPARGSAGLGQNEALMIVGGAAILVGAVVGGDAGDIFMIGGAIVGLYGLYKYLQ
jgi:hypothetical protein